MPALQFFVSAAFLLVISPVIFWAGTSNRYALARLASVAWLVLGLLGILFSASWPLSDRALLVVAMWVIFGLPAVAIADIEFRTHRARRERVRSEAAL